MTVRALKKKNNMAFKMKGSPMERNFGVSPMKDAETKKAYDESTRKNKIYLDMRKDEFTKDSEGIYRDSDGLSVSQRRRADERQSRKDKQDYQNQ